MPAVPRAVQAVWSGAKGCARAVDGVMQRVAPRSPPYWTARYVGLRDHFLVSIYWFLMLAGLSYILAAIFIITDWARTEGRLCLSGYRVCP